MNSEPKQWEFGRRITALLVILVFSLTISACGATGSGNEDRAVTGEPGPVASEKGQDWEISLTTDKKKYRVGEGVPLALTLTNLADTSLELTFPSAQTHDFLISNDRGQTVWQWSAGRAFAQALTERTLVAGGSLKRDASWDGRDNQGKLATAGQYEVEGWFTAKGFDRRVGPLLIEIQ